MSQEPLDKYILENMETTEIKLAMTESNQSNDQDVKDAEIEHFSNESALSTNLVDGQPDSSSSRVVDEHSSQLPSNTIDTHPGHFSGNVMLKSYAQVVSELNTEAYQAPINREKQRSLLANFMGGFSTKIAGPLVKDNYFDKDAHYIETVFHLHIPAVRILPNLNRVKIAVLGSVKELGNWKNLKVQLFPINLECGHWASYSIRIKLTRFEENYIPIQYKYAIYIDKRFEFEGSGYSDNRNLQLSDYQFDLWKLRQNYHRQEVSRCSFVRDIIMDLHSDFDCKLTALNVLHTTLPDLIEQTISNVDVSLQVAFDICNLLPKEIPRNGVDNSGKLADFSTEQYNVICPFIFLCIYLGQYLQEVLSRTNINTNIGANVGFDFGFLYEYKPSLLIFLPIEFPSSLLLSLLGHQTSKGDGALRYAALQVKIPKDLSRFYLDGITTIVQHSIENEALCIKSSMQLEWMFAFRLTIVLSENDRQLVDGSFVDNYTIHKELLQRLLNIVELCKHSRYPHSVFIDQLNNYIIPTLRCLEMMQTEFQYEYMRLVKILISCASTIESLLYLYENFPIIRTTLNVNHENQETLYTWFKQRLQAVIEFQDALSLQAMLVILPDDLQVSLGLSVIRDQVLKLLYNRKVKWSEPLVRAIIQLMTDERIYPTSISTATNKEYVNISGVITNKASQPAYWVYINQAIEQIRTADNPFLIAAFPELLYHFLHHAEGCSEYLVKLCCPWFQNLLQHDLSQEFLTSMLATCKLNQTIAGSTHCDEYDKHITTGHQNDNKVYCTFLWLSQLLIILQPLVDSRHSPAIQVQNQLIYLAQMHVKDMPEKSLYSATTRIGYLQPECIPRMYQMVMLSRISGTDMTLDFKTPPSSTDSSRVFAYYEWNDQLLARILLVCSSSLPNLKIPHWLSEQVVCYLLDQSAPICLKNIEPSKSSERVHTFEILLRNAEYWPLLFMATGSVTCMLNHPRIQQIRGCIIALKDMIFDGSITMHLLRGTVQRVSDNILLRLFECATLPDPSDNNKEEFRVMVIQLLKKARIEPDQYLQTLQLLDQAISRFCIKAPLIQQFIQSKPCKLLENKSESSMAFLMKASEDSSATLNTLEFDGENRKINDLTIEARHWTVVDAEDQLAYLQQLGEQFPCQTLISIHSQTQWGSLRYLIEIAQDVKAFMESSTFMNVFLETVSQFLSYNSTQPLDVNYIDNNKGKATTAPQQDNENDDKEKYDTEDVHIQNITSHILTIANVAKLISTALDNYRTLARLYVAPTPTEVKEFTMAKVLTVWHDISDDHVERELEMLRLAMNIFNPSFETNSQTNTLDMIHRVVSIEDRVRNLSNILAALAMLEKEFAHSENILRYPNWVSITITLLSEEKKIEHLESVFDSLEQRLHFTKLSDNDWKLISELTMSGELIRFLKTILDIDFRSLINAVEDHSDHQLLREDTVSSLIEVRRLLSPLMEYFTKNGGNRGRITPQKYSTIIDVFLDDIHQATEKSPQLATKLSQCNANKIALQNMYANITNRGEVTKDRIINAANIGVFTFKRTKDGSGCETSMHYTNKQSDTLVYNLNDLYDLRGRAFMIAGSTEKTEVIADMDKNLAMPGLAPTRIDASNNSKKLRAKMMTFVQKVDIANEINITASKLIDLGHFIYAKKFRLSLTSIGDMTLLLDNLIKELKVWQETVAIAHAQSFYLTFFRGRQILQLYDLFFEQEVSEKKLQEGAALLKFVSSENLIWRISNVREKMNNSKRKIINKDPLVKLLDIGHHLDEIFADMPQPDISKDLAGILDYNDTKSSLFHFPGQLVVAACNDKTRVPNIVMELYVKTVSQKPEPWQLYVCRLTTTWEEIDLFLLRCFHAHAHGYENSLFCMTNLEELNFDLQYKLVKRVRALISDFTNSQYLLTLICYREHSGVHILDQLAEYVRNVSGLSEKSMEQVMAKICPTIVRVTSNITGQGKTEWIKDSSHRKGMIPRNLHLSGTVQRASLVRRFQAYRSLKSHECLHLDIGHIQNPSELNILLFELLTLGMLTSEASIAMMPSTHIFIEIASTPGHELAHSIPICDSLTTTHLQWDIDRLQVSSNPYSPIQVTCHFLDLLDREQLDSVDVKLPTLRPVLQESDRCRVLLDKYFFQGRAEISSFRFLDIFLRVLAEQLVRFSKSTFFNVSNLKLMTEKNNNIRSTLVDTLVNVSKDFATRSVAPTTFQTSQLSQSSSASKVESSVSLSNDPTNISSEIASSAIGHNLCLTRWTDSNHLLVFFQSQNPEVISALYRDCALVPKNIETLLQSQFCRGQTDASDFTLEDYTKLQPKQLLNKLEALARSSLHQKEYPEYALSLDNLLKMAIMLLRLRANLPVVLCGEAGCGKTSLIRFLSLVVEVPHFMVLNMHAGITEDQIINFMNEVQEKARASSETVWVFFDEINTCNHLPLVADIICHKMFLGRPVSRKLQFFAACNPYRLRDQTKAGVAGLSLQDNRYEERSPLVYQVLPLPQILIDYVWSFGALQPKDEEACINVMIKSQTLPLYFAELFFQSQQFMRELDGPFSVSLRDVKRTLQLVVFFLDSLKARHELSPSNYPPSDKIFSWPLRAVVLALALSYQSRIFDQSQRLRYRQLMCTILQSHQHYITDKRFQQILQEEEEDYLKRMTIPPSVAWNEALLENTLAMIVCTLTRIPLFLVGAPGSSKSLAVRLIHQNLKGSDSVDPYFRTLPQIYIIPHQGSSSSTSEGITKVFETANKYQEMNSKAFPLRTVVLLDEIGLAEGSPFNPLKVLHYLLEPSYPSDGPTVSVIGISNWRLDLSKTSRALLVQRPQLSSEDLIDTAMRVAWNGQTVSGPQKLQLKRIAQAYIEYEKAQKYTNFHGLRDYYSFVKTLGKSGGSLSPSALYFALARHFGGLDDKELLWRHFSPIIYDIPGDQMGYQDIPVLDVITSNLTDTVEGRHLMVIGNTSAVIGILQHTMTSQGLDPVVIYGSQLPEDQMSNDYLYGVLNKILMCVETGRALILSNLNILYGSLYDLWNQNYMAVGSKDDPKYYCRVALGEYANPMCYVHPRFRSILVMDENEVQFADPPLLNRFEKQRLSFNDTLEQSLTSVVEKLALWTQRISTPIADSSSPSYALEDNERNLEMAIERFTVEDMFVAFDKQVTLASLVIYNSTKQDSSILLDACKTDLINIAFSDAMVRSAESILATIDPQEVAHWKDVYFNQQQHDDLRSYITALLSKDFLSTSQLMMVKTFSNINVDIYPCLDDLLQCQVDKLSTFKSEAQLSNRMKLFWNEPSKEMLILQCDGQNTSEGVLKLAKHIIELQRREYLAVSHTTSNHSAMECTQINGRRVPTKHVIIMLHVHRDIRGTGSRSTQFDFLSGWSQVVIETLEQQPRSLSHLLEGSIHELIQTFYPFEDIFSRELSWCLVSMKYPDSIKGLKHMGMLVQRMPSCGRLIRIIHRRVNEWLNEYEQLNWQAMIARTKQILLLSASFPTAIHHHIRNTVRIPVTKLICSLEHLSALTTYLDLNDSTAAQATNDLRSTSNSELLEFWEKLFEDKNVVSIEHLAEPGPDVYSIPSVNIVQLRFPFSKYFTDQIDSYRQIFQEESETWKEDDANLDPKTGDVYPKVLESYFLRFSKSVETKIRHIRSTTFRKYAELYFEDYIRLILHSLGHVDEQHERILKHIFEGRIHQHVSDPIRLHIEWWKNNAVILAELELILSCGADIFQPEYSMQTVEFIGNDGFEEWLMNKCSDRLLRELLTGVRKDFSQWCQNTTTLLSFCIMINSSSLSPGLQLLRVLNDFVSELVVSLDFPLPKLRNIIIGALNLDKKRYQEPPQNVFTNIFVSKMLAFVESLPREKYAECKNTLWRRFLSHCLNALPPNSEIYVTLFQSIFSETNTNIPFLGPILLRIFRGEEQLHPDLVRDLILPQKVSVAHESVELSDVKLTLNEIIELNPRLYAINKGLTVAGLNSRLAALTCDVIQIEFFAPLDFDQLYAMFRNIKEVILTARQLEVLQSIIVVAYLKELISGFRKRYVKELGSLENMMELDRAPEFLTEFKETILDINSMFELNLQLPVVNSARIYFLKGLRITMDMSALQQFCSFHYRQLPWLANLAWDFAADEARLPFNPFHSMLSYGENNGAGSLKHLLTKAIDSVDERVTLLGSLAMGFQFKQATRKLNDVETQAATWIRDQLQDDRFKFSDQYQRVGICLLENNHPLIQVSQNDSIPTLLMKSVVIHVIVLHASMPADASPLAVYAHNVPNISRTYFLTCPSNAESVILNALTSSSDSAVSRWSCICGYHYVIGNCGETGQESICPECKNKIGGLNHVANDGNIKLDRSPVRNRFATDQVGYILEEVADPSSCGHVGHTVRSLCKAAYRILHLFVHALLPPSVVTTNWQQYCLNHIENDWIQLKLILNCNDETLALILHAVVVNLRYFQSPPSQLVVSSSRASPDPNAILTTVKLRDQWESAFSDHCVLPVIRNVHQKSMEFAQCIRSAVEPSPLDIEINEFEMFMSPEYIETHHPRLWRHVDRASFDGLRAYCWSDPVRLEKHRFLSIFFQHHERLDRIQYLIPIIKFVGIVSARLAHRLKRQEARSLTFRHFMEQQHDYQALEASFDRFAHAWNSIRSHITRYQCHEFKAIPMIDREMPITFAILREEDESIYVLAVLEYLVTIQNAFLNETNKAMVDFHFAAGKWPTHNALSAPSQSSFDQPRYLRSVRLTDAHSAQVIVYEWDPAILQYSQRSTDLGMGGALAYDLAEIELKLVHELVFNKAHLEFEWEPFAFHLELFHGGADILADVAAVVEQEPLLADTAAAIRADGLVIGRAPEILSDLELLLSFIKRTGIAAVGHSDTILSSNGGPAILITDYCKQWVKLSVLLGKSFQQTVLATMQLKYVVGLYELVEEMVSDVLLQFLAPVYKQSLSSNVEKELTDALALRPSSSATGGGDKIPAWAFATALKRFMTRYLSVGQGDVRADTQLVYYLGDPARFWPVSGMSEEAKKDLTRVLEEAFPESLMVSHTHAAYKLIVTQLEPQGLADNHYTRPDGRPLTTTASPSLFKN